MPFDLALSRRTVIILCNWTPIKVEINIAGVPINQRSTVGKGNVCVTAVSSGESARVYISRFSRPPLKQSYGVPLLMPAPILQILSEGTNSPVGLPPDDATVDPSTYM